MGEINTENLKTQAILTDDVIIRVRDISNRGETKTHLSALKAYVGSSGGGVISKTVAEIQALILSSGLTVGQQYLLTDFVTKHYIVDSAGTQYLDSIITGVTEPLIVTAIAVNKLCSVVRSTLYPQDILHVDFDENNWLDDLSFADLSGTPTIVTGWKGTIFFRHDTLLDNYMGYDFRNCKFRRWKTDVDTYVGDTTYEANVFINDGSFIYRSLQGNNAGNTPDSSPDFWQKLIDLSVTLYWNNNQTSTHEIASGADFSDFKTFAEGSGSATYDLSVRGNHFDSFKDNNSYFDANATILSNNVFFLQDVSYYTVINNVFAAASFANTITGNYFTHNRIGAGFHGNTIDQDFDGNMIGSFFANNIISSGFFYNLIGEGFNGNFISSNFNRNSIGANFINNTGIKDSFQMNTVGDSSNNGINFAAATHVYAAYNCQLSVNNTSAAKLVYLNGTTLTVVDANA